MTAYSHNLSHNYSLFRVPSFPESLRPERRVCSHPDEVVEIITGGKQEEVAENVPGHFLFFMVGFQADLVIYADAQGLLMFRTMIVLCSVEQCHPRNGNHLECFTHP